MPLDQETINQQQSLLATHRKTLAHLIEQAAQHGGEVFAPPQTFNGISVARGQIQAIKIVLRASGVQVDDLPGDDAKADTVRTEDIALGLGEQTGALVVYCKKNTRGQGLHIKQRLGVITWGDKSYFANVVERIINGRSTFAAVFPRLPPADYTLWPDNSYKSIADVTVFSGEVAEVDWR